LETFSFAESGTDANTVKDPIGVVLAGGASRRMGRDKALLVLPPGGETLAAAAARRLAAVCAEVLVADRGRATVPALPSLPDGPGRGPAAGLLGAAAARPGRSLLVLACDLPAVPVALLACLAGLAAGADLALPRWSGGLEPLCAAWGPAALARLAARVERGLYALHPLAAEDDLAVRFLEDASLESFGPAAELFRNVNTPDDL
jgi:molybdopterin-guanine dinucleotide biosynthesis protein A